MGGRAALDIHAENGSVPDVCAAFSYHRQSLTAFGSWLTADSVRRKGPLSWTEAASLAS